MDAKAAMKARMREAAQKRFKRIDSPLVRYNDLGQPLCKVCNIIVKSETLWPAHIASRQHKAAVDELKAKAAAQSAPKAPPEPQPVRGSAPAPRPSSALPDDFFDSPQPKRVNRQGAGVQSSQAKAVKKSPETVGRVAVQNGKPSTQPVVQDSSDRSAVQDASTALPEGFFDSVDADHKARGLEPPKVDIKEEYKEFQKFIKDDVMKADAQLEEEEAEAAEEREQRDRLEQRSLYERIERLKQRQQERLAAARVEKLQPDTPAEVSSGASSDESDEEEDDSFFVDWRAKTL